MPRPPAMAPARPDATNSSREPSRERGPRELALQTLLNDLGPQLRRGGFLPEPAGCFDTGVQSIDALLSGGFPRGRLSEIAGTQSSGRTSLALALLARATRSGQTCAIVDAADGLDPMAAARAGVLLPRVLWARAPGLREALSGTERLLEAQGFGLVLLHMAGKALRPDAATCSRLARAAAGTHTALVVLSLERSAGTNAEVALEMRCVRAHFTGTPPLLERVESEARVVRHRTRPGERSARVELRLS